MRTARGSWWRRFWRNDFGVAAIVFAMTFPAFVAAAGVAVDLARGYNAKTRLGNALDKAALAAGTISGNADVVERQIRRFITANYPTGSIGETYDLDVQLSEMSIRISARARVQTMFMGIFGYREMTVSATSEIIRELSGVEVVLVLDVTGSMAGNNIAALKTAGASFLRIMFERISDPRYIRVGIVPFSNSVNVGNGLAAGFVTRPTSDDYVSPASSISYSSATSTSVTTAWKGCIVERAYPRDTTDAASPNWTMYRYPPVCSWTDSRGNCLIWARRDPNYLCPNDRVVPLTNDRALLESTIANLRTGGNTFGNVGMAWGWRVISPGLPYNQGSQYGDPDWSKIVVMMTDGDNVMDSVYSAHGRTSTNRMTADDLDDRFEETCTNMKQAGITVYTITFQSGISNATRDIFRRCATRPEMYFNAPSNADLEAAFRNIANQLSALHLSK